MSQGPEDATRAEKYLQTSLLAVALRKLATLYPDLPPVMVVGAECRDALHRACGYDFALRNTTDLDIALAVEDLEHYEELTRLLEPVESASNGIRYWVAGIRSTSCRSEQTWSITTGRSPHRPVEMP